MSGDALTYAPTSVGWALDAEAGVVALVAGLLGSEIQADEFGKNITAIGHHPIGKRWLVIGKPTAVRELRGRLMDEGSYAALDFDPFAALAGSLADDSALSSALEKGPQLAASSILKDLDTAANSRRGSDLFAPEGSEYLTLAYAAFRGGSRAERMKSYWSVLPARLQAPKFPLCRFSLIGQRRTGESLSSASKTHHGDFAQAISGAPLMTQQAESAANATAAAAMQAELAALKSEMAMIAAAARENAGSLALLHGKLAAGSTKVAPKAAESATPPTINETAKRDVPETALGDQVVGGRRTSLVAIGTLFLLAVSVGVAGYVSKRVTDIRDLVQEGARNAKAAGATYEDVLKEAAAIRTASNEAQAVLSSASQDTQKALLKASEDAGGEIDRAHGRALTDFEEVRRTAVAHIEHENETLRKALLYEIESERTRALEEIRKATADAVACIKVLTRRVALRDRAVAPCGSSTSNDGRQEDGPHQ